MAPEPLLGLYILVLDVGGSDLGEHILDVLITKVALCLHSLTDNKLLRLVIRSVDAFLCLIFAMVHLEERVGDPKCGTQHH